MPYCFIQPRPHTPFKNPLGEVDDPFGDFTSGEVAAMNNEYIEDEKLREAGHND